MFSGASYLSQLRCSYACHAGMKSGSQYQNEEVFTDMLLFTRSFRKATV
jgi:hypothetical protein